MARYLLCHRCPSWLKKYNIHGHKNEGSRITYGFAKVPQPDEVVLVADDNTLILTTGAQAQCFTCSVCRTPITEGAPCVAISIWRPELMHDIPPEPAWEEEQIVRCLTEDDQREWDRLARQVAGTERRLKILAEQPHG